LCLREHLHLSGGSSSWGWPRPAWSRACCSRRRRQIRTWPSTPCTGARWAFPVNILHTLVHLVFGIWGVLAYRDWGKARTYAKAVAVIYAVFAIMGLVPGLETTFGLVPLHGNDVWLHLLL